MNPRTLARSRFARTSAEGGGGGNPPANDQQQNPPAGGGQNDPPAPVEAVDEHGVGLGFPKDTEVSKMSDPQKASYWRNQSKVQQKRADDLERAQRQGSQQSNQNPPANDQQQSGQQSTLTREQIEAEIRADVSKDATVALLRSSLHTRGKNAEEIDDLLQFVTPDAFLTAEKKIDNTKVSTYLDRVAPAGTAGGTGGIPGQGRFQNNQKTDPREIAREEAKRRGYIDPGANRGALGGLRK